MQVPRSESHSGRFDTDLPPKKRRVYFTNSTPLTSEPNKDEKGDAMIALIDKKIDNIPNLIETVTELELLFKLRENLESKKNGEGYGSIALIDEKIGNIPNVEKTMTELNLLFKLRQILESKK